MTVIDALGNQNNCLVVAKSESAAKEHSRPLSSDSEGAEEDGKRPAKIPIISYTQHPLQQCESITSTAVSSFETCTNTTEIAHPDIQEAPKPSFLVIQEDLDYALRSRKGGTSSSAGTRSVEAKPSPPVSGGLLHQIIHWLTTILSALFRRKTK